VLLLDEGIPEFQVRDDRAHNKGESTSIRWPEWLLKELS